MTPSQQTIQLIRDAIVSGNQQDAEKALEQHCLIFYVYCFTVSGITGEKALLGEIYQRFNQRKK